MTSPYDTQPDRAFWRKAVTQADKSAWPGLFEPKFKIRAKTAVATAGSCFAQHIGRALRGCGMNVLDAEPAPENMSPELAKSYGYGIYSARYGNIYTPRQLREMMDDLLEAHVEPRLFWEKGGRFYDALRPGVEPKGCDSLHEAQELRRDHLVRVAGLVSVADVFIFTLGLTEAWIDVPTGRTMAIAPGVIAGDYDPAQTRFHNFTYAELLEDMEAIYAFLREVNPNLKLLLTVSPVPLTATASGEHVLTATTYSKSLLRAVAGEMARRHKKVDYFPSYELVTTWAQDMPAFEDNLRSVRPEMVARVMSVFLGAQGLTATIPAEAAFAEEVSADTGEEADLVCEEVLLEALRP